MTRRCSWGVLLLLLGGSCQSGQLAIDGTTAARDTRNDETGGRLPGDQPIPCDEETQSCASSCVADTECPAEQRCDEGVCVDRAACLVDDQCGGDERCMGGICMPRGDCASDTDCLDGDRCLDGACVDAGCTSDADCASGEVCGEGGGCIGLGECAVVADCPPAHRCRDGSCELDGVPCSAERTSADCASGELLCCPAGESCCAGTDHCSTDAGVCLPEGRCFSDSDCQVALERCGSDFRCAPTTTCPCPPDQRCSADRCVPLNGCLTSIDCLPGTVCTAGACTPANACGTTTFEAARVPPNVLVLLDRSGSMNYCDSGDLGSGRNEDEITRWEQAGAVLTQVLPSQDDALRWGLSAFPGQCSGTTACIDECKDPFAVFGNVYNCNGTSCPVNTNVTNATVPAAALAEPDDASANTVLRLLAGLEPGGGTPAGPTLRAIAANPAAFGLDDPDRENVILYVTDGRPNSDNASFIRRVGGGFCGGGSDGEAAACKVNSALARLRELDPPISTYVVGFTLTDQTAINDLKCFAVNGGTSLCDTDVTYPDCGRNEVSECHYQASDQDALAEALVDIAGRVGACSFTLDQAPPDLTRLFVFLDGADGTELVPRVADGEENWTLDLAGRQLRLLGSACDAAKAGATPVVVYGCPDLGG